MPNEIQTAFSNYLDLIVAELSSGQLLPVSAPALLEKVGTLEGTAVFRSLMDATQRAFPADGLWIVNSWASELGNFFRRSGFYEDVYAGRQFARAEELLKTYQACLDQNDREVRYFAPIDAIDFGVSRLDFGEFSIRKFSAEEIDEIFENDRRKVFTLLVSFNQRT